MSQAPQVPAIRILRFWTEYKLNPDGSTREIDMVEYGPVGLTHMRTTRDSITRLAKVRPIDPFSEDEAAKIAAFRWALIEPQYRAWKKGQDMPDSGMPLSAWPALAAEQLEIIRGCGLRSVEELADANDATLSAINLPNARTLKEQAKLFLSARDRQAVANRVEATETENKALRDQLEEMRQMMLEMQQQRDEEVKARTAEKKVKEKAA